MKSILRCLSVALLAVGCNSDSARPQITHIEPSIVTTAGLPYPISIVGANLRPAVALSLDDKGPLEVSGVEVHLNGISAPILEQSDGTRLRVLLPESLTLGNYDVTVTLGPSRSVVLANGLQVMGELPSTSGDASSTDSSPTTTSSGPSDDSTPSSASSNQSSTDGASTTSESSSTTSESPSTTSEPLPTSSSDDGSTTAANDSSSDEPSTEPTSEPSLRCAPHEFGPAERVTVQGNYGPWIWSPAFSQDGNVMFFTDSTNTEILMVATRTQRTALFSGATPAVSPRPQGDVGTPFLSQSELSLYFHSTHNGPANRELYVATRPSPVDAFSNAKQLRGLNAPNTDHLPWVSPDELTIIYVSARNNGASYFTSTRPTIDDDFSPPVAFPSLPGTGRLFITPNGLRAYFVARDRPGGHGSDDIWFATRESTADEFSNITNLHVVNGPASDTDVTLTADGEELFFIRSEAGGNTLYRSVASCE